jgi:hypothetical protein
MQKPVDKFAIVCYTDVVSCANNLSDSERREQTMRIRFYEVVDRESTNPAFSHNYGDYTFWRVIAVAGNTPIAVSYRTSADVDYYCAYCGCFGHTESKCLHFGAEFHETKGWKRGRRLTGEEHLREFSFFTGKGWFNPIRRR